VSGWPPWPVVACAEKAPAVPVPMPESHWSRRATAPCSPKLSAMVVSAFQAAESRPAVNETASCPATLRRLRLARVRSPPRCPRRGACSVQPSSLQNSAARLANLQP